MLKKWMHVPMPIGTKAIPINHIRLFHFTKGDPELIKEEGIKLSYAQGSSYGEPDMIWASTVPPDITTKNVVEFSVPSDSEMELDKPKPNQSLSDWMAGNHHVGIIRDIMPDEIIAVHEPWHEKYRWIKRNPNIIEKIKNGYFDALSEEQAPEEFKAIQVVKNENL